MMDSMTAQNEKRNGRLTKWRVLMCYRQASIINWGGGAL